MGKPSAVTLLLPFIVPLLGMPFGVLKADHIDALDLQYQWSYPLSVVDMKLVDFDKDGAAEILVGFDSDSARAGILDVAAQTLMWQSPGLPGWVQSVAAGDRNEDEHLDIVAGGLCMPVEPYGSEGGYVLTFDGPSFDSTDTVNQIDLMVTAAGIFKLGVSDTTTVIAGTRWDWEDDTYYPMHWFFYTEGHLFFYDGAGFALFDSTSSGQVRAIDAIDVSGDSDPELITAEEHHVYVDHHGGTNIEIDTLNIRVAYPGSYLIINIHSDQVGFNDLDPISEATIDALAAGNILGTGTVQIIASWRELTNGAGPRPANVSCFDGFTGDTIWSVADSINPGYMSGLAICDLSDESARTVCAAYSSGSIRYKSGIDGSDQAVSCQLPEIQHFALGNVDYDDVTEICIASAESVYVYEAPFITTDVDESVPQARPNEFSLHQNYPNPFNPETIIHFTLPKRSGVRLAIYDVLGRRVRTFERYCQPGTHTVMWDGKNSSGETVASGICFYRFRTGDYEETKKMVLLR